MESPIVYYVERIQELEKQLADGLEREKIHLNRAFRAEKKLEIAVKALEFYAIPFNQLSPVYNVAQHHKEAEEALAKIKEIK